MQEFKHLNPRVLLWVDISYSDMEEINNTQTEPELERVLCRVLDIQIGQPKMEVLLELYTHTFQFGKKSSFNMEQISTLISIVKAVHQANTETPLNNMGHCSTYCIQLLLCHSVRRPPFSVDLFRSEQVTQIANYLSNTYFRNYALYKYIFSPQVRIDLYLSYSGITDDSDIEDYVSPGKDRIADKLKYS